MTLSRTNMLFLAVGLVLTTALSSIAPQSTIAQDIASTVQDTGTANDRYVPDDALAALSLKPLKWFENPMLEMFPIEVIRVQLTEQIGIDPMTISEIKAVVSLDPQTMQPRVGAILTLAKAPDFQRLLEAVRATPDAVQVSGRETYPINGPPGTVISLIDDQTVFIGTANYMQEMLDAEQGTGDLPVLLRTMTANSGLTIAVVMEQIRPIVSGVAMQNAGGLAPDLQPLAQIPGLTEAIKIHADFIDESGSMKISVVGTDEVAAQRIEAILVDSLVAARVLAISEINRNLADSDQSAEMQAATDKYANRMADKIIQTLTPKLTGDEVSIEMQSQVSIATTGVLVGLLLPAVQAARQAAQRMSGSNNLKQVGLALHNYHAAYNRLPPSAITDKDGKPLLSWRVAILPFIEEQALYEKFRLDEPWDSEHNLPLSKELPAVYDTPGVRVEPGKTIIQAVVGEDIGMRPLVKTAFRDFLDGLSNTILVLEVNPDAAVVWSAPEDLEIDLADPLANLGNARQGGFHVLIADGAVRFVAKSIDVELFKHLLTRAGAEVVDLW